MEGEQPTDGHAGKPQGTSVLWDSGSERTFCHLQAERNWSHRALNMLLAKTFFFFFPPVDSLIAVMKLPKAET